MDGKKIGKISVTVVSAAVVLVALYIMANGLGLVDSLDFGAGAYYYADIPGYEKIVNDEAYRSPVSMWLCIVLFLVWGFLMYRLWCWIDRK